MWSLHFINWTGVEISLGHFLLVPKHPHTDRDSHATVKERPNMSTRSNSHQVSHFTAHHSHCGRPSYLSLLRKEFKLSWVCKKGINVETLYNQLYPALALTAWVPHKGWWDIIGINRNMVPANSDFHTAPVDNYQNINWTCWNWHST